MSVAFARVDAELEAVVLLQIFRGFWGTVLFDIGRTRHQKPLNTAQLAGDEACVCQPADTNGEIRAFLDQIDIVIGDLQFDRQFWMSVEEFRQGRCDVPAPEDNRNIDAQRAAGFVL